MKTWRRLTGAWAVVAAMGLVATLSGQGQAASTIGLLETLLNRAGLAPGTYLVTEADARPAEDDLPVMVQADVLRGATEGVARVMVALGTEVPQAAEARVRLVRPDGPTVTVIDAANGAGGPGIVRLIREFSLPPGEYELEAAVGYPARSGGGVVAGISRSRLSVPDVWGGPLAVTPIVLASAVATAPSGTGDQPFTFGPTALAPSSRPSFAQQSVVNVAFRVYNWQAAEGERPDLSVEYVFYQMTKNRPVFFNKTKSQRLDADSLNATFDSGRGVVSTGMMIPLRPFPFGDFELRVRVTDHRAKQTAERQVRFTVSPS